MRFYGISFVHPHKKSGRWQGVLDKAMRLAKTFTNTSGSSTLIPIRQSTPLTLWQPSINRKGLDPSSVSNELKKNTHTHKYNSSNVRSAPLPPRQPAFPQRKLLRTLFISARHPTISFLPKRINQWFTNYFRSAKNPCPIQIKCTNS